MSPSGDVNVQDEFDSSGLAVSGHFSALKEAGRGHAEDSARLIQSHVDRVDIVYSLFRRGGSVCGGEVFSLQDFPPASHKTAGCPNCECRVPSAAIRKSTKYGIRISD